MRVLQSVNEDLKKEPTARLDSCHVRSDTTFSNMDVAIFDFTLVTIAMVTGKEYGIYSIAKTDSVNIASMSTVTISGVTK